MSGVLRRAAISLCALALLVPPAGLAATRTGGPGDDVLTGTSRKDRIVGRGGNDKLYGRGGPDTLLGGPGRDLLAGDTGNDYLRGGGGADVLVGGGGRDRIDARDRAADTVSCGNGYDVVLADGRDQVAGDCESVQR